YRKIIDRPQLGKDERLLLHFGAVDYSAQIWVNGVKACAHQGGYTPFHVDITALLMEEGAQEIVVRAEDDPLDLTRPRGKQDWKLEPHSIWYPRTTGIWQTVWLEPVHATFIESIKWTCNLVRWEIGLDASVYGAKQRPLYLAVRMRAGDLILAEDVYSVISGEIHRQIALSDPGIDDSRNELLWSPASPTIIDVELELRDEAGKTIDRVYSYTALRTIAVQGDRFILNGRPLTLRLVLDQGYWPETGLTAPSNDALLDDVLLAKKMGFNGVRKHQKIEDRRYLYWADRLGLLVWEEMPSAYRYTSNSIERLVREWTEVLQRDSSHPCIVAWVPFNESWGVPDLPDSPSQRNYVQALYHLTKTLDPTRPVIGNDGWESVATDIIGIHDYDKDPQRIGRRYRQHDIESPLFKRERPGGRMLLLNSKQDDFPPIVLSEFGGIAFSTDGARTWGYSYADTPEELLERYRALLEVVRSLPLLAGFCYTQFTDTYQEANGLLFADRTPKMPLEEIALATSGIQADHNTAPEVTWRERFMERQR
ncbi:MAG: glycoside hydrolase family 2, partial [Acidobacteriaceae bacterium]|nr:glycoside hydrolase family 2 [Acidobacteriaceae bacterium]